MKKSNFYFFVIALLSIVGCDNGPEPIPAYIHVEPFVIGGNPDFVGSNFEPQIRDVWVSDPDGFIGAYELPATLPIIGNGLTTLTLDPGILENGISATPGWYELLQRVEVEVDLAPNQTDTIRPNTTYDPRVQFHYVENFDNSNSLNVYFDTASTLIVETTATGALEGNSATFTVTEDEPTMEVATLDRLDLPTEGDRAFIELHYKNESILEVGLVGYRSTSAEPVQTYFIALNPQQEWNKIYINLMDQLVASADDIDEFQILFGTNLPTGQTSSTIMIDNIKVVSMVD